MRQRYKIGQGFTDPTNRMTGVTWFKVIRCRFHCVKNAPCKYAAENLHIAQHCHGVGAEVLQGKIDVFTLFICARVMRLKSIHNTCTRAKACCLSPRVYSTKHPPLPDQICKNEMTTTKRDLKLIFATNL